MLRSLIAFCLSRRLLVMVAFAAFLGLGGVAFLALNIEAYPDPAPPIIEIIAQQQGQSPEEVERYITIPIEIAVASTPGLKFIRSNTVYGLGFIRLQFEYGRDYHFVRQQTINRLKDAVLPAGVLPVISPAFSANYSYFGVRTIGIGDRSVNDRSSVVGDSTHESWKMVLALQFGIAVLVSVVAMVQIGYAPRRGLAVLGDKTHVVTGIV